MNKISAQHATLLVESTKRAVADEKRLDIPFKPRHEQKKVKKLDIRNLL